LKGDLIKLMAFLAFALVLPGVYAVEPSVYASGVDSTVGFTSEYSMPDSVAVTDLATLSFSNGPSLSRHINAAGTFGEGSGDFSEEHSTENSQGASASVSVNILGSEWYDYSYSLDPIVSGTGTKPAKASENLDVKNAASVSACARAENTKGDWAYQTLDANSATNEVSLDGYSNSAQADKTSATASQSFKSLTGDYVSIENHAGYYEDNEEAGAGKDIGANACFEGYIQEISDSINSKETEASDKISNVAKAPNFKVTSTAGYDAPNTVTVTNLKTTSTMKSETSPSATFSADSIEGGYIGYWTNAHTEAWSGTKGNRLEAYTNDNAYGATISKLSQTAKADAKSASVTSGYNSLSAAFWYTYSEAYDNAYADENHIGDYSLHGFSAIGPEVEGFVSAPIAINGFSQNLKAQTSGTSSGVTILNAIIPGTMSGSIVCNHLFGVSGEMSIEDQSRSEFRLNNGKLENSGKSSPAYKATTAASPKSTKAQVTTVRGKADELYLSSSAWSNALSFGSQGYGNGGLQNGYELSSTASTASSGKLGDKKGAKADASVKLVKNY